MDAASLKLLAELNCAVIQFRGLYAAWAKRHGISYNEMLVYYTIRDQGYCTQKQLCDSYLLPRQTINHVMLDLRARGLLTLSPDHCTGREKAFVLTPGAGNTRHRCWSPWTKSRNRPSGVSAAKECTRWRRRCWTTTARCSPPWNRTSKGEDRQWTIQARRRSCSGRRKSPGYFCALPRR